VAVAVDGQQPIGTRSRLMVGEGAGGGQPCVIIRTRARPAASTGAGAAADSGPAADGAPGVVATTLRVTTVADLSDYNQPHAEGAIVKCALLCLGLVQLPTTSAFAMSGAGIDFASVPPLAEQLTARLGGSLEVETWSLLPHGSGLGGSSILSATVLSSLARTVGLVFDLPSLNHLVLKVEQMLSTGGGWQDQVGGMWPGVKASSCTATLPVAVTVQPLSRPAVAPALTTAQFAPGSTGAGAAPAGATVDHELSAWLNDHLVLVYTGKTRLAKNLLQRVLRQWAMRENDVTQRVADLRSNAVTMAAGIVARDAAAVGASLSAYWEQKKGMAPMAEPAEVGALIAALKEAGVASGASLTGAGGGGFLVVVTREPRAAAAVARVVAARPGAAEAGLSVHTATVDEMGLVVRV
jgi:fucokinase